jgi:hypothetical protein
MITRRTAIAIRRGSFLSVAAAFGFFLAASAPHRVHHFFEQFSAPAEQRAAHVHTHEHADGERHSHHDHHNPQPKQQNDCVVLSVAQNAHASLVHAFDFSAAASAVARRAEPAMVIASSFNLSPFSQRAPPRV